MTTATRWYVTLGAFALAIVFFVPGHAAADGSLLRVCLLGAAGFSAISGLFLLLVAAGESLSPPSGDVEAPSPVRTAAPRAGAISHPARQRPRRAP